MRTLVQYLNIIHLNTVWSKLYSMLYIVARFVLLGKWKLVFLSRLLLRACAGNWQVAGSYVPLRISQVVKLSCKELNKQTTTNRPGYVLWAETGTESIPRCQMFSKDLASAYVLRHQMSTVLKFWMRSSRDCYAPSHLLWGNWDVYVSAILYLSIDWRLKRIKIIYLIKNGC